MRLFELARRGTGPRRTILVALLVLLVCAAGTAGAGTVPPGGLLDPGGARSLSAAFAAVAKAAYPAVVFVRTEKVVGGGLLEEEERPGPRHRHRLDPFDFFSDEFFERFFRHRVPRHRRKVQGQGSGFLVSPDGYILTNNHVVEGADTIHVKLADDREVEAELVGADPSSDVAVLSIDAGDDLPFLEFGDSDALEIGEWVLAVGNPFGLAHTLTAGIVSAKGRTRMGITDYEDFIQTDAAINPGNSGGPLLDLDGRVVGINTAIFSRSGGYMGIGFSIPINMVAAIYEQLRESGQVRRGYFGVGIQELTEELAESFGMDEPEGVLIATVEEDSAADEAGLEPGDVILKLEGKEVDDLGAFRNQIALHPPGSRVRLVVLRDGIRKVVWARLRERDSERVSSADQEDLLDELGFTVKPLDREAAREHGYDGAAGVVVDQVKPGSPAAWAGIRPGALVLEVSRQEVEGVADFLEKVEEARESGRLLLLVRQGRMASFLVLPFGK